LVNEDGGNDTETRKRNQGGRPAPHFQRGKQSRPRDGGIPRDGDDRRLVHKADSEMTKTNKKQGVRHFGKPVNGDVVNRHGQDKSSHGKGRSRHHPRPQNHQDTVSTATN
jgi:hypothetical protein